MSLACNHNVDDALIAKLNTILEDLRKEGVIERIAANYG